MIKKKVLIAAIIALSAFSLSYFLLMERAYLASDFQWPLRAGQYLLEGKNPYLQVPNNFRYPYDSPFFYPLPTALFAIIFSPFKPYFAGALFFGLSSGLLAFSILRDNPARLPVFFSANFFIAAMVAQWSPLIMAAALLPGASGALAFLKPNLGMLAFSYRPNIRAITVYLASLILSFLIIPNWIVGWLTALSSSEDRYQSLLLIPGGFIMLLAVLAIKTRAGRTLLAMAIIPIHSFFYDGLLLWLIPKTLCQNLIISGLSWIAYYGWKITVPENIPLGVRLNAARPWQLWFLYVPLLFMVLRHTNLFDRLSHFFKGKLVPKKTRGRPTRPLFAHISPAVTGIPLRHNGRRFSHPFI